MQHEQQDLVTELPGSLLVGGGDVEDSIMRATIIIITSKVALLHVVHDIYNKLPYLLLQGLLVGILHEEEIHQRR